LGASGIMALWLASAAAPAGAQAAEPAATAADVAALRAEIQSLRQEVDALKRERAAQAAPAAASTAAPASTATAAATSVPVPNWKGALEFRDPRSGFAFKPKGFMQLDAGYVSTPGPDRTGTVGGLNYDNLGWNGRARRVVLGVEGSLPGGFGYNLELNFAQGSVDYEDIVLTYQPPKSPLKLTLGNFFPLSSLETMTSARLTSFLERASFTDAFTYNRRLGFALGLSDPAHDRYTLTAGLFGQEINNAGFGRTGWQASVRGTFSPTLGEARLHLGANFQHRVAPRNGQSVDYRSRPFTQVTDQRFVDTGPIPADGDDIAGLEFGAIAHSFHAAAEAQQLWVRGRAGDPQFRSAYGEVGYYLTGETRGYKAGHWERTRVLHPFSEGGWGALQVNGRVDWLDLRDRAGPTYFNGGRQLGYELSLIWNPIDYIRFQAQFARAQITGGPRTGTVVPASAAPLSRRDYGIDTVAVRAQVEF
jgi:phosphate-selective porin OprO/OprP